MIQSNLGSLNIRRISSAVLPALAICLAIIAFAAPASAQNGSTFAYDKCTADLKSKMSDEMGGSNPDVIVADIDVQTYQAGQRETGLRGKGRYIRDNNDQGRNFTFNCTVNVRGGDVSSSYRWTQGDNSSSGGSTGGTDPQQYTSDKCIEALTARLGQDVGGNQPGVSLYAQSLKMSQVSNAENGLRGRGTYTRNSNDKGRDFNFQCTVNTRENSAVVNSWRWR